MVYLILSFDPPYKLIGLRYNIEVFIGESFQYKTTHLLITLFYLSDYQVDTKI